MVDKSAARVVDAVIAAPDTLRRADLIENGIFKSVTTRARHLGALHAARVLLDEDELQIGAGLGYVLAASVGRESLRVGLVDPLGRVQVQRERALNRGGGEPPEFMLGAIRRMAVEVLDEGLRRPELTLSDGTVGLWGMALALPTPIDAAGHDQGRVLEHRGWRVRSVPAGCAEAPIALHDLLAAAIELPPPAVPRVPESPSYLVINDANAEALAETFNRRRTVSGVLMAVKISGGVGSGTVEIPHDRELGGPAWQKLRFADARVLSGGRGLAGEIGHLRVDGAVVQPMLSLKKRRHPQLAPMSKDWECSCGETQHLESYASATAFVRRMDASDLLDASEGTAVWSREVQRLLRDPSAVVRQALADCGELLGSVLAGPILTVDPDELIITGFLAHQEVERALLQQRQRWDSSLRRDIKLGCHARPDGSTLALQGAALRLLQLNLYRQPRHLDGIVPLIHITAADVEALEQLDRSSVMEDPESDLGLASIV